MTPTRFLLLVLGVFIGLSALYVAAFSAAWRQTAQPHDPQHEILLVKKQLLREAPAPRWIIVGGSSAWFGFESELLAEATGETVVNLGTHAEIPLWFQLGQVEREARPGDTVLLAAELVHYWRKRPTTFGASRLGAVEPEAFAEAGLARKWELIGALPPSQVATRLVARMFGEPPLAAPTAGDLMAKLRARWSGTFVGEVPGYYNYLEIDRDGDFSRLRPTAEHAPDDYGLRERHDVVPQNWRDLAESARRLKARGVRCRFTWPPFELHGGVDFDAWEVRANIGDIRARLAGAGWQEVGAVEDAMFATEFFYDTGYHLTTEGARERTRRLIERARAAGLLHAP